MAALSPPRHLLDSSGPPEAEPMLQPPPIFEAARRVALCFAAELPVGLATDYGGVEQPTIRIDPAWWTDTPTAERRQVIVEAIVHHAMGTTYRPDRLHDDIARRRVREFQAAERSLAAHLALLPNLGALPAQCHILSSADGAWLDHLPGQGQGVLA